jgi:glycosyltransferase involved in cell wall biosynthesis
MITAEPILLSILTASIPERSGQRAILTERIAQQIGDLPVEHLSFIDNRRRSIGAKRDALLRIARGTFIAYVDDDDTVSPDYVASLVDAIKIAITTTASPTEQVDVITFAQFARVDEAHAKIVFGLRQQNQPFVPNTEVQRAAWHVCAWRRSVAILSHFPESNYGEDWAFAEPLNRIARASIHLDKVLHYYRFNSATTAAPYPDL